MLNVVMLNAVMLNVVMLSVVMLSAVMLNVVAPSEKFKNTKVTKDMELNPPTPEAKKSKAPRHSS